MKRDEVMQGLSSSARWQPDGKNRGNELVDSVLAFRTEFVLVGLLSALANLLMLTPTIYMLQIYDRVMVSQNELTLVAISFIAMALFGVIAVAEWARSRILVSAGLRFDEQLGTRIFNASFDSRLSGLQDSSKSPSRAFSDLLLVRQFLTGNGIFAFFDTPWVPIYLAVCFLLHPLLGWLSILFACIQLALAWLGHRANAPPAEAAQLAQTEVSQYVQSKLRNTEVLESMGMIANLRPEWERRHQRNIDQGSVAANLAHRLTTISKFIRYTQQSLALGAGALLVIDGELSPGAMIAANVLISRALAPIDLVVSTWRVASTAREAFKRLSNLLIAHPVFEYDPALKRMPPRSGLMLRGVVATAPAGRTAILHGIDLELAAGTVLVVLGPSGSGKSTLARVILGIWGAVRGEVLLDGLPVAGWNRVELGSHLGYLPQDIELFDGTVAENIARFGQIDSKRVIAAARSTGLHETILRFPKGYETPIGEAGGALSGGQRQRIALARAVYGQPALVVLDEPNANLDEAGEIALAGAVQELKAAGSTVVLISHRSGAIALADWLLILNEGRVQIQGPRDAVIAALRGNQR
jgi:ATP-binding cassette subfamily C exporter for protease/lipase